MQRRTITVSGLGHGDQPIPLATVVGGLLVTGGISGRDPATGRVPEDLAGEVRRSDKPQIEGGRFTFYATVFRDLLAELGVERAHVLGMATGGGAAMRLATMFPDVVDRLVLVSSFGGLPLFTPTPSEGQKIIRGYYGGDGPSYDKMRRYLEMMLFDRSRITDELVRERYEASIDPDFMATAPEGRGEADTAFNEPLWKDMEAIAARTLVVWGRDNRVQGYDNALFMLNRIPDVELHVYGRTGLWVSWERAREFERLVTDFLTAE